MGANFAKELTERGIATRIPGAPEGCKHKALKVSTSVGTRMVLALECKPGQAEAVKGVNLADQCLHWCAEKLAMHFVPAAVVIAEVPDCLLYTSPSPRDS